MKVIALTGPKGSGKDTVADLICKNYDRVTRVAFADPIKTVIQHIFCLDNKSNDEYDRFKRSTVELSGESMSHGEAVCTWKNVQGRHIVREIGMLMRSYDSSQFTKYVKDAIIKAQETSDIFVVTDLRFDNEFIMLKEQGAKIVKITRPTYHYDGHITERGFNDYLVDYIIANDYSMDVLEKHVLDMVNKIEE